MSEPIELPLHVDAEPSLPLVGAGRRRTGERLDPAVVERILEMRRDGCTVTQIQRELGSDHRTILSVIRHAQDAGLLPATRDHLLAMVEDVARLTGEEMLRRLVAAPNTVPANVLPIMFGVAVDKRAVLQAEAEASTGRTDVVDPVERLKDAYAGLRAEIESHPLQDAPPAQGVEPLTQ